MSHDTRTFRTRADDAAVAWLNAAIACGRNKERKALFRTVSVEFFKSGVQFVGCDGTMLFRTWAPYCDIGDLPAPMPSWLERPSEDRVVVADTDKFALTFMRTLLPAVGDEPFEMHLSIEPSQDEDAPPLGDELAEYVLVLHALGQRLSCRLYDGTFPDWRALQYGIDEAERVEGMIIAPRILAAAGKLKGVSGVDCEFMGDEQAIRFVAHSADPRVAGLLMAMRRLEPRAKKEAESEPELQPA